MGYNYEGRRPSQQGMERNYITAASTGTKFRAPGVYTIFSTASLKTYTLLAPRVNEVGAVVEIHCIKATTNLLARVCTTGASMYSTVSSTSVTKDTARFNRADQCLVLRAMSTAKWHIITNTNAVTITTS